MGDAYEHRTFDFPQDVDITEALKRLGDERWEITYVRADHSGGQYHRWVEARRPHHEAYGRRWEYKVFSSSASGLSEEIASGGWQLVCETYRYFTEVHWLYKRTRV